MSRTDRRYRPAYLQGETLLIVLTACVAVAAIVFSLIFEKPVNWLAFAVPTLGLAVVLLLGGYLRQIRGKERWALFLNGSAIYLLFGMYAAILTFTFLPVTATSIDPVLIDVDAAYGFSWGSSVELVAQVPLVGKVLQIVHSAVLWQLPMVIGILAILRREADLHRFVMAGTMALLLTLGVWVFAPSFGPAAYANISDDIAAAINLSADSAQTQRLMDLAANGASVISPEALMGAIAFPSYFMVILCLSVYFLRKTIAFWPAVALNSIMVPAVVIHGGHHLIDIAAGVAVFGVTMLITRRVVDPTRSSPAFRHRPV